MAGWVISAALVVLLVARIDVAEVTLAIAAASPVGIAIALALVSVEVGMRARRWQILLEAARPVRYPRAAAYLCVGYFANSLLPARLGDLARAHLAGRDFGIARLTTLGTIVVERVADATVILTVVVLMGVLTPEAHDLMGPALAILVVGACASAVVLLVLVVMDRRRHALSGLMTRGVDVVRRIADGAAALRSPRTAAAVIAWTVAAFAVAIIEFWVVAGSVGLRLSPVEAAIVMGALALSTSIPAAPGSLGTYEIVGVAVLTQFGAAPVPALAAVVLMHVIATLPPALVGLGVFVHLHLRLADIQPARGTQPALVKP